MLLKNNDVLQDGGRVAARSQSAAIKSQTKPVIYTTDGHVIVDYEFLNFIIIKMKPWIRTILSYGPFSQDCDDVFQRFQSFIYIYFFKTYVLEMGMGHDFWIFD